MNTRPANHWRPIGAALMFLAVAFGAFGAHALKTRLSADALDIYHKAVLYQMVHALGLLAVGRCRVAGYAFCLGILFFSGSLYLLALTGERSWGAVTPVGGVLFLAGWAALALARDDA